jgi:hypothetical protein
MRYIIYCLPFILIGGCGGDTKLDTQAGAETDSQHPSNRQFDFRGYKIGDSITPLIEEMKGNSSVLAVEEDDESKKSFVFLGLKEDGSDTYHGNDDSFVDIAVWTMPNSDQIASIIWHFPSRSRKVLFEQVVAKIGEPHDTEYREWQNAFGATLFDETHYWRLGGNVSCLMSSEPFNDGFFSAETDDYREWRDKHPPEPAEDSLQKRL